MNRPGYYPDTDTPQGHGSYSHMTAQQILGDQRKGVSVPERNHLIEDMSRRYVQARVKYWTEKEAEAARYRRMFEAELRRGESEEQKP